MLFIDLFASLAPGFGGALLIFYFESARGFSVEGARGLLLFYFAAGLIGAPAVGLVRAPHIEASGGDVVDRQLCLSARPAGAAAGQ